MLNPEQVVFCSWLKALGLMIAAAGGGALTGWICHRAFGVDTRGIATWLAVAGVAVLLWATLGHAGWSIQTYSGNTLAETLNQTIYRALHMLGSFLLA